MLITVRGTYHVVYKVHIHPAPLIIVDGVRAAPKRKCIAPSME